MNNLIKKINILLIMAAFVFSPLIVYAQDTTGGEIISNNRINYEPLTSLPGVTDTEADSTDLGPYLRNLFNFFVGLAAILAVFIISLGGFLYISSDSFTGKSTGKSFIWNAIQGLLIVLASYIVLYTINPDLLDFKLRPSEKVLEVDNGPTDGAGNE